MCLSDIADRPETLRCLPPVALENRFLGNSIRELMQTTLEMIAWLDSTIMCDQDG